MERTIDDLWLAQEKESLARTHYFFVATEAGHAMEWWREVRKSKGHSPDEKAAAWNDYEGLNNERIIAAADLRRASVELHRLLSDLRRASVEAVSEPPVEPGPVIEVEPEAAPSVEASVEAPPSMTVEAPSVIEAREALRVAEAELIAAQEAPLHEQERRHVAEAQLVAARRNLLRAIEGEL